MIRIRQFVIVCAAAALVAACVPIGVKSTSLPYAAAPSDAPAAVAAR